MEEEMKLAYAAGIFDSDGSIGIHKQCGASKNPLYYPIAQLGKRLHEVPKTMYDLFGGNLCSRSTKTRQDGTLGAKGTLWSLRSCKNVEPMLKAIIPYLRVKKERAREVLNFIEGFQFVRGYPITQEVLAERERYYLKLKRMQKKQTSSLSLSKLPSKLSNDPIAWSYIAGLMDTDGSFSVKKQVQNKGTDVKNPRYLPVISLSMVNLGSIDVIAQNCPYGKIYIPRNKWTKRGYHYQFGIYTRSDAIPFLKHLIPYMRVKKPAAEILLHFCENMKVTKSCRQGIPIEELKFRENCYLDIKNMNENGVYKPSLIDLEVRKQDDRGEGESHAERLNEKASKEDATV